LAEKKMADDRENRKILAEEKIADDRQNVDKFWLRRRWQTIDRMWTSFRCGEDGRR
jgi:hypothetical protein